MDVCAGCQSKTTANAPTWAWDTPEFRAALAAGHPGEAIAAVRQSAQMSQTEFAALLGWETGTLRRAERGQTQTLFDVRELRRIADTLAIPREALVPLLIGTTDTTAPASPAVQEAPAAIVGTTSLLSESMAETPTGKVGTSHLTYLRAAVHQLTTAGYHVGAADLVGPALRTYQNARTLLDKGDYPEHLGSDLASVAGELAECAGWQAYDSGDHALARKCYNEALVLAQHSGDTDLAVRTLSSMTRQSCHLAQTHPGYAREAKRLARRAGDLARQLPRSAMLQAHIAAREAIAAAAVADERGFELAMMHAWREADRGLERSDNDPAWLGYMTVSEIGAHEAKGRRLLGQHAAAADQLREVVSNGQDLPLYQAIYGAYLSSALVRAGDLSAAVSEGLSTLAMLEHQVKSARLLSELAPVRTALKQSRTDGATDFRHRFDALAAA